MALQCNATGEYIDHGSDSSLDSFPSDTTDGLTVCSWINPDSLQANSFIVSKGITDASTAFGWRTFFDGSGFFSLFISYSTPAHYTASNLALSAGTWSYVAARFLEGRAGNDMDLVVGDLTTKAAETTYSLTTDSSGTYDGDASEILTVGNVVFSSFGFPMNGLVGIVMVWNAQLTVAQMIAQQYSPYPMFLAEKCRLHSDYHGTGIQADLSGNGNNGTVNNATKAAHVPLGPPFGYDADWTGNVAAAAAGGRIMSSLAAHGGLAGPGGIAGPGGGLAASAKLDEIRQRQMVNRLLAAENQRKFEGLSG